MSGPAGPETGALPVGAGAPDFTLRDQHGRSVSLSAVLAERTAVLMFYPFAFSRVCTGELGAVREHLGELHNDRVALLAISCDPVYALRVFAERDGLEHPLLSDFWPHGAVSAAYGVLDEERGCPRRSTYVVDPEGTVRWADHRPSPEARDLGALRAVLAAVRR